MDGSRRQIDAIDAELVIIGGHRADKLDVILRAFFDIIAIDNRTEILLKRRSRLMRGLDPAGDDWWDKPPAQPPMIHR